MVRIGTTAYVFSGDEFRDLKFSDVARIVSDVSTWRASMVIENERSISSDTKERNVLLDEPDRRIESDE